MGYLRPDGDERDLEHVKRVERALKRRGMVPVNMEYWEVHGPHQDMEYYMYVGEARRTGSRRGVIYVSIYPWATYEVPSASQWWDIDPSSRIPVLKR